jgi:hypothetical protein
MYKQKMWKEIQETTILDELIRLKHELKEEKANKKYKFGL